MPAALERLRLRLATGERRSPARRGADAGADGIPAGAHRHRGGGVQRAGRHRGRVRIRDGGAGPARVVGRRRLVHPRLRPDHPALAAGADRSHGAADQHARRRGGRQRRPPQRAERPTRPGARCWSCCRRTRSSSRRRPDPTTRGAARLERGGSTISRWRAAWARTCPPARTSSSRRQPGAPAARFPRLLLRDEPAELQFGFFPPEQMDRDLNRLRGTARRQPRPRSSSATTKASSSGSRSCSTRAAARRRATLAVGALDGGFVMPTLRVLTDHEIFRRARRLRRAAALPPGRALGGHGRAHRRATTSCTSTTGSGSIAASRHLVGESTIEVAVVEYEGGDRLNVPLYRLDQLERYRAAGRRRRPSAAAAAPARRLALGSGCATRRGGDPADGGRAARPLRAAEASTGGFPFPPDTRVAARARVGVPLRGHARPAQGHRRGQGATWSGRGPWTASSWATSATARPRSRCAPRSRRCRAASRWPCSCRRRFWPSSTAAPSPSGWPTFRSRSRCCRASGPRRSRRRRWRGWRAGEIDIVIGTHRLLSKDVLFKDLGLLVVDEEHRFGVKHKERLKELRLSVDVLTLTATPIPRTLHLSLAGLRDLTLIETPPRDRSPMLTFVEPWDDGAARGGVRPRARSRRAGLHGPQPHRDHRDHRRAGAVARAARPCRRWPTARWRPTSSRRSCAGSWPARSTSSSPR